MKDVARKLISDRFDAVVEAAADVLKNLPVERENLKFTRPKNTPWGRYSLMLGTTKPLEIGVRGERTPFIAYLQIFIPEEAGTAAAYQIADALRPMRELVLSSGDNTTVVHVSAVSMNPTPGETGLASFNVTMPGYFDYYPAS